MRLAKRTKSKLRPNEETVKAVASPLDKGVEKPHACSSRRGLVWNVTVQLEGVRRLTALDSVSRGRWFILADL